MNVYLVTAYRFGNRERHSYPVSVRSSLPDALDDAEFEEEWRGGKYVCEVMEWEIDRDITGHDYEAKTIKPLPERTIQQMMADFGLGAMPMKES
jgi:hypothetical protein